MTDTFRDLIIRTSKNKEEAEFRTALHEALAEFAFDKNEEGKMNDDLVKRLREWGKMNDDLVKRLREYGDWPQDVLYREWAEWSHKAADCIEKLEAELRELHEVYAGSEGIPEPMTSAEGYLLKLLTEMVGVTRKALEGFSL